MSRRGFLNLGAMSLAGIGLEGISALRQSAKAAGQSMPDTSVIFVWLPGGPPHMETYDMKPDAPAEYRGEFAPIRTVVPGIDVCEYLPMHAKVADKFALIRSIAHNFSDHGGGHKRFLTGRDPRQPVGFVNDYPMLGSMIAEAKRDRLAAVPNYIAGVDGGRQGIDTFSFGSAYLGPRTHPFMVVGDPADAKFQVQNLSPAAGMEARFSERSELLAGIDHQPPGVDRMLTDSMDSLRARALGLLTTDTARNAFDLSREPRSVRDRYGMHRYGQRCLLARRLVEAGSTFVTMVLENPSYPGQPFPKNATYNWDSHAVNCHIFEDSKFRLPPYDQAISALVEDLYARGLDRKVLLVVTGEFGRTPRISHQNGTQTGVKQPGRDHWPAAMSVLVSGGGLKVGQVVGSTNSKGEHPKDRPMTPNDLWATVLHHLGIDHQRTEFLDHQGRPMPILPYGDPIQELL
jgi:hypothetical protein